MHTGLPVSVITIIFGGEAAEGEDGMNWFHGETAEKLAQLPGEGKIYNEA